ncbi:hypothetical protein CNI01355 [Cryptococcus deneoformans JEC21]|uniref:Uncharacterized protein n=1 Tax=Cryptococcus deneoformans (strain JEC21 / ATCC MYA-565) TaxID=214684 RepID=A0A0S2LIP7_CRYD1|nr:hypothetical protein CNI01355 [Cryptococcus neoformans var. neoformans JEC21]ALO60769.1 hypothetical protein CNI01355 [Cryptococcus neoformans var. neoformans JEC21]
MLRKPMTPLLNLLEEINKFIQHHNPIFYEFVEKTLFPNVAVRNKASKVLFSIISIGILQVIVPIFRWPLTLLASFLQFTFLYSSGIKQLRKGFASSQSAAKVKSILTVYVVTSTLQLVPGFIFDTRYHFGALWDFFLPFVLFIVPWKDAPEQTLAASLCDTLFATLSTSIGTLFAPILPDHDGQITAMLASVTVALMFWAGYLAAQAAFFIAWAFVGLSTVNALGQPLKTKEASSVKYYKQMTVWHNLMAIWLWRILISAIEGINVPGIASATGLILHFVPTFYLWATVFMLSMLVTKKSADHHHNADTWYARCLTRSRTITK